MLGQGVATPDWVGRGDCTGRTEDYPLYAQGADVLVNYTYPLTNGKPLELVATGIVNLNAYANYQKPIMADLEASSINGDVRATPHQLRAEVWQSLIHGAAGITYFCHRTTPLEAFNETDCLDDAATAARMTRINRSCLRWRPRSTAKATRSRVVSAARTPRYTPCSRRVARKRYVFAASMADGATTASLLAQPARQNARASRSSARVVTYRRWLARWWTRSSPTACTCTTTRCRSAVSP